MAMATSPGPIVSTHIITQVNQFIEDQLRQQKTVGCAVAIVDQGKIVFIKSYGVLKKGKKELVNKKTIFQLGSISKTLTGTLVAKLVKEEHLHLDMPAQGFVPSIAPQTTLRHILSHTTGFSRQQWNQKIEAGTSRELLLTTLSTMPNQPGRSYDYHNFVFSLAEEAISISMQAPFATVMKAMLLDPLGMRNTTVGPVDFAHTLNFSWPHQKNDKGAFYASKGYSSNYHKTVCSAGGINSNITDMAIFLQVQLGDKPEFLTIDDLASFHNPYVVAPDALNWIKTNKPIQSYYGLGWRSLDYGQTRIVFHGGWLRGFVNFLGFIPAKKVGIVVLNNSEGSFAKNVALAFFDMLSTPPE